LSFLCVWRCFSSVIHVIFGVRLVSFYSALDAQRCVLLAEMSCKHPSVFLVFFCACPLTREPALSLCASCCLFLFVFCERLLRDQTASDLQTSFCL